MGALVACSGDGSPADSDGGLASTDAGPVTPCSDTSECDDGDFCNGVEVCQPAGDGADARGCVPGAAPCEGDERCDEEADVCVETECAEPDADGDGADRLACGGDDCDDEDATRYPGNIETCDSVDNDCDPSTLGPDQDGDGYVAIRCCNDATCGRDCDDTLAAIHPDASEICDGADNDCDGSLDEGVTETYHRDRDGDGFGNPDDAEGVREACTAAPGWVLPSTVADCDDTRAAVSPGALERCDGVDNDCDMSIDEDCECIDGERRACGTPDPERETSFLSAGECVVGTQRCLDGRWDLCVGARGPRTETCNELDDDCDGAVDEGVLLTFYRDGDRDGFGDPDDAIFACTLPGGYATLDTDCNDDDRAVSPAGFEICDGIDNDCDGETDNRGGGCACVEGEVQTCGVDTGACVSGTQTCDALGSWGPCVGEVTSVDESARTCNDVDDDCDGRIDEGVNPNGRAYYRDRDGDGYGGEGEAATRYCDRAVPAGFVATNSDCDETGDRAHLIHPGAAFQTAGHCDGTTTNCFDFFGDPGCQRFLDLTCRSASFDYNCDGAVDIQRADCTSPLVCGGGGAVAGTSTAQCGREVDLERCFLDLLGSGGCRATSDGTGTQACR